MLYVFYFFNKKMKKTEETIAKLFSRDTFISKIEKYMSLDKRILAELLALHEILYSDTNKKWCPGIEAPTMLCDCTSTSTSCKDYIAAGTIISAQA